MISQAISGAPSSMADTMERILQLSDGVLVSSDMVEWQFRSRQLDIHSESISITSLDLSMMP